jgi:hypothetical protein
MRRYFSACAILTLGIVLASGTNAQQVNTADHNATSSTGDVVWASALGQLQGDVELASCDSCNTLGDCDCGPSGGGLSLLPTGRGSQFFVGGEYLYLRATPSEAIAYLERDLTTFTDTFHQFDFDYDSSFRVYGGCRNCCGEEVRFTFSRFDTGSNFISPTETSTTQIIAPLEQTPIIDGSRVVGSADIRLDSFDLGWSKTIPLGSPLGCDDCCEPCGDCCDPCSNWCPAWDLTFTGAVRAVNFDTDRLFNTVDSGDDLLEYGNSRSSFDGVGARVGMLGRRYFGRRGVFSMYMKGDLSLLVGQYNTTQTSQDVSGSVPGPVVTQTFGGRQVVPVTEIEAGASMFVTRNTSLSTGYFISAWHDLGFRDEYDFQLQNSYDDANIMAFDGFFVRLETAF